ncbi:MAG: YraN family protein [Candidatus Binataceae bacterium]
MTMAAGIVAEIQRWRVGLGDWLDRWCEELPWRQRIALGRRGEAAAGRHLKRCGYRILARNFHVAGGEIDLIAMDRATLVFVEVKARSGAAAGLPEEAVDARKQGRIRRAAAIYAARNRAGTHEIRFDVVAIMGVGRKRRLEIFKDAF